MKLRILMSVAAVSLLFCGAGVVFAQDERPQESRPEATKPQEKEKEEAKPSKQDEAKPPKHEDAGKPAKQEEVKPPRQEAPKSQKQEERAEPSGQNQSRAAAHSGGRIPDDKFRSNFGRQHTFAVNQVTVVEGQPRFQYSGYWFTLADPWPVGWAYTDDCYIDYIDGEYFLFDLLHPGVRIAVLVVM